ncbi:tRNA (adenosine(37)-N6)-threonylcarbamoyltransferase complex transferase subunit TsaD [Mycoplasmopsis phocirhinis]|uniref:tRNA N6-adenosine threonylcarbamoyltransferase n=1 Tax=Mycoplasmopsis phocirhinis TaxID=142650 RepID=A0A4P6MS28_9BACT|nr:tRNA (adenosine(37)-N6)-threonylcarbamoyltransferase complex transferase subunit TsaD [Mycoplasmopsis phocirhinis]QBF34879.1 tRNA (adenosine(37)-N6)-threonylcarbamoyltransferase complex transferase subunit TsaD [Mycoplasmopsis phocirhinis]
MRILGIETSHDDTSIALLEDGKILEMKTISQIDIFKEFGGTIPEISSRIHVSNINIIQLFFQNKYDFETIDFIAYTQKPGLIGTLQIGYLFASALSLVLNKKLIPINHLEGHFYSNAIEQNVEYPSLCLLVSGGHTQLMYVKDPFNIEVIGETLDDAVGEAYDKISSKLGLGFPGGPIIDKIYQSYTGEYIKFTKPHTDKPYDFSFSGLKSQVLNYYNTQVMKKQKIDKEKIAASFQQTAIEYLISKTQNALESFKVNSLTLAGGVSANTKLREEFLKLSKKAIVPNLKYATDNGAMIAMCAYEQIKHVKIKNKI